MASEQICLMSTIPDFKKNKRKKKNGIKIKALKLCLHTGNIREMNI